MAALAVDSGQEGVAVSNSATLAGANDSGDRAEAQVP